MFKGLLLPNYISEEPQFFRDASNFAKYWKKNITYISGSQSGGYRSPGVNWTIQGVDK